jgi:hypothetical protein
MPEDITQTGIALAFAMPLYKILFLPSKINLAWVAVSQ